MRGAPETGRVAAGRTANLSERPVPVFDFGAPVPARKPNAGELMRVITIALAGASVVLVALTLIPAAGGSHSSWSVVALIGALSVLALDIIAWSRERTAPSVSAPVTQRLASPAVAREAELIGFLAILQERGRLVDFLQDDISGYTDAQVGAAARVVHQGCKSVLHEYVEIVPVRAENEGSRVTVAAGYAADEYRFVGKISGQAPFSGTLMHRGWKAGEVTLPRILTAERQLPTIAPAEVELR